MYAHQEPLRTLPERFRTCSSESDLKRVIPAPRLNQPLADAIHAAEGLYRLVDAAYKNRSVTISSNLHPSGFDELMPKTLATATVDRLLHHAHVCQTSGESVGLTQALAGQGVSPLA